MRGDEAADDVDLLQRHLDRARPGDVGGNVDRPELAADMAGAQPLEVGLERPGERTAVERHLLYRAGEPLAQLPGEVVVAVDDGGGGEDALGTRQRGIARRFGDHGGSEEQRGDRSQPAARYREC